MEQSSRPAARERKKKPSAEQQKRIEALKQFSPDEVRVLRDYTKEQLARYREAKASGKAKTFKHIRQEIRKELPELDDESVRDVTNRSIPRWKRMEYIPGERLRPGATKMLLRPEEEDELPLNQMGRGNLFSPRKLQQLLGPRRDCAWAIYAIPSAADKALGAEWGRRDPATVLQNELFYFDVLRRCVQLDLTLMLLTSRPLALGPAQAKLEARLREGMRQLKGANLEDTDEADLKKFVRMFDEEQLQRRSTGVVEKGAVREGTHLIFSTSPRGDLTAEAITPGPVRDRKHFRVALSRNPLVTGAMFEMFLGQNPLDPHGKQMVGNSLLWCANGFRFKLGENPDQYRAVTGKDGRPHFPPPEAERVEWLPRSASIFRLLDSGKRMLLGRVRQAQQQLAAGSAADLALQK